jgi:hypothetical protein
LGRLDNTSNSLVEGKLVEWINALYLCKLDKAHELGCFIELTYRFNHIKLDGASKS